MGRKGIPDRWLDYTPIGQRISGTNIVAFKVPLKMNICRYNIPEDEWFTPSKLLEKQPLLKTVIDLTNTHRYYNGNEEFGAKGIDHVKILVEGRGIIPPASQIQKFFEAMEAHLTKYNNDPDALIGVHCTHGLNRTGFFVCRWMVDRLKIDPEEAIARFNQARGHSIEREQLLRHIRAESSASHLEHKTPSANDYRSPLEDPSYDDLNTRRRWNRQRKASPQRDRSRSPRNSQDNHDESKVQRRNNRSEANRHTHRRSRELEDRQGDSGGPQTYRHFGGTKRRDRPRNS